jgi:predicted glycoside hydrolase/deacetylase ChbG (UPF0249 family)
MGLKLQLVITADDLGLDAKRDEGIFHAWSKGAITQASLMVAGRSAKAAADRARRERLPLGLHLDLTELPASAPAASVGSLLGPDGHKRGKHGLREAVARGEVEPAHLEAEAQAQLLAFALLTGRPPQHVDGHQHIHCVPKVAQVLAPVFSRAGVRSTRIPEQSGVLAPFYATVSEEAAVCRALYRGAGVRSTEAFSGLDLMGEACSASRLVEAVRTQAGALSLELMCHVGYAGEGHDDFNRSPARQHELNVYCALPFVGLVEQGEVELVSFASASARGALR